jgi:uncharacterized protein
MADVIATPELTPPPKEPFFRRISPIAFIILSLALVFLLYQVVAGVVTILLVGQIATRETAVWMRIATAAGQILCILLPTILLARARYGRVAEPLRLRLPSPRDIVTVCIAVVALQQVLQGYMIAQDSIPLPPQLQRYVEMFKRLIEETYRLLVTAQSPLEFAGVVATVALVPAVVEELLFRGLVQRDLEDVMSGMGAAILSGVIFGFYHLNPFSIVPLVGLGVFFGFVVHRSKNITLAMTAHFINNFIACCALYLNLGDNYLVFAPGSGASAKAVFFNTLASAVVFVASMYYFAHTTSHDDVP